MTTLSPIRPSSLKARTPGKGHLAHMAPQKEWEGSPLPGLLPASALVWGLLPKPARLSRLFFHWQTISIQIHLEVPFSFNTLILTIISSDNNPRFFQRYRDISGTTALKQIPGTGLQTSGCEGTVRPLNWTSLQGSPALYSVMGIYPLMPRRQ